MTIYGCPACNGTWEEKDEAAAHCLYSSRNMAIYKCACGRYRHCDLGDFIRQHLRGCDQGKAVFGEGFKCNNRSYQAVMQKCLGRKPASLTYPFSLTEIQEDREEGEANEVMRPAFPAMSAPPRTLPAPSPPVFEEQQRPIKRRRAGIPTRVPEQSASSPSRLPLARVATPGASMPSQFSTTQMPNSLNLSASPARPTWLGLPPPGPLLSSLIGQDATHMSFNSFVSKSPAASLTPASSNFGNGPNRESHGRSINMSSSPVPFASVPPFLAPLGKVHTHTNREFSIQANTSIDPNAVIDLTHDDVAPPANVNTHPNREFSTQVDTSNSPAPFASVNSASVLPSLAPPGNVTANTQTNREFATQAKTSTPSNAVVDLTDDDVAPSIVPSTVNTSIRPRHERSSQDSGRR
ncbi:uncharacterized protein MYCFIDRAFT_83127 [Pseudocercospora fijiensis CIRAD86]|uniref:Uncharacterized protein n=1 Tax=Pseudocercospora fijiensis (strain CIRAD86) TaxID=383855 RepID=M3A1Q8_PSEFD|nr:uncharacterized protein MYCFIDRAFT_83127 [Pseudocercospora fijiensis CIRAD86]EME85114.1 hypothetical protein MYCFIDRAFT_83127 [Pseudocercospora fijiensis CIRAD86]